MLLLHGTMSSFIAVPIPTVSNFRWFSPHPHLQKKIEWRFWWSFDWNLSSDPFVWNKLEFWARHAGHCWRSKDELVSDVLLWTPTYGQGKAGRPARTYIQQLCEDTGCNPEDLPEAINDREKWREMVKDIRAGGTTWWWWWWYK